MQSTASRVTLQYFGKHTRGAAARADLRDFSADVAPRLPAGVESVPQELADAMTEARKYTANLARLAAKKPDEPDGGDGGNSGGNGSNSAVNDRKRKRLRTPRARAAAAAALDVEDDGDADFEAEAEAEDDAADSPDEEPRRTRRRKPAGRR